MQKYYGTKNVAAKSMSRAEYNEFRGWTMPDNEDGADAGYLVEYLDGGEPNVGGHTGYVSWSPKEQFEKAYKPTTAMSFGHAIEAMKAGQKVARHGWNGKGLWLELQMPDAHSKMTLPYIYLNYPDGSIPYTNGARVPWLASQTDVLAEDWMIVD